MPEHIHAHHGDIAKRLKRANGHLKSIIEMIETERPCALEYGTSGAVKAATVNFLSEKCNVYRYTFKNNAEDGTAILSFTASENIPNLGCDFIPEYSNAQAEWYLQTPGEQLSGN